MIKTEEIFQRQFIAFINITFMDCHHLHAYNSSQKATCHYKKKTQQDSYPEDGGAACLGGLASLR